MQKKWRGSWGFDLNAERSILFSSELVTLRSKYGKILLNDPGNLGERKIQSSSNMIGI